MTSLLYLFLLCTLTHSHDLWVTDGQTNATELNSQSNETEMIFEQYFPILLMLVNLPENETESLEKYLHQRTYAELKRMIDEKTEESIDLDDLSSRIEFTNATDLSRFMSVEDNKKFIDIIEAYHNASIYALIRGVWNSQLHTLLPPIDQLAILEYFEERNNDQQANMTFLQRLWQAIQNWFQRRNENSCAADRPECMRRLVDRMQKEERQQIEKAADSDDVMTVEGKIKDELDRMPSSLKEEFIEWRADNYPPVALLNIIYDATKVQKDSLERLRTHGVLHAIKDYYRAMIEMKPIEEQQEIRQFFLKMNDTFARCYNPTKAKFSKEPNEF